MAWGRQRGDHGVEQKPQLTLQQAVKVVHLYEKRITQVKYSGRPPWVSSWTRGTPFTDASWPRAWPQPKSKIAKKAGSDLDTVNSSEAWAGDVIEAFQSVSEELAQLNNITQIAEGALRWALELTQSSVAFVALVDDASNMQVFSRAADPSDKVSRDEIERLVAAADASSSPVAETQDSTWSSIMDPASQSLRSFCGQPLKAGGKVVGMIGVARSSGYAFQKERNSC